MAAATGTGGTGPARRPTFTAFDTSDAATCSCRPERPGVQPVSPPPAAGSSLAGVLGLLLGLLAAAASWWGVSQRLQEYR